MNENQPEGNSTPEGGGAPTQPSSGQGQPLDGNVAELVRRLGAAEAEINALKGGKDKAVDRMEAAVKPLIEKLAPYLSDADNQKLQEATRAAVLDDIVRERLGQPQPANPSQAMVAQRTVSVDVSGLATQYGLDPSDPAVSAQMQRLDLSDPDKTELEIARMAKAKKSQPSPTAAQQPITTGGQTPSGDDEAALIAKVNEWQKHPVQFKKELDAAYRKLGWK